MIFLLVSVTLFGLSLCGVGCLFGKILGYSSPRNPWIYFWLGFFAVSTLSMFVSLFFPINLISLIIFFILGAAGLPFFYRENKKIATQFDSFERKLFISIAFLAVVVIACLAAYSPWPGAGDTNLYHAQIIRWYNEYGTPPGLGNLHARLAFNSSWLSLAALFDNGIWDGRSAWIMPALSLFGGIFYCLHELIFSRKNGTRLYVLCILLWIGLKIVSGSASPALYYDTPVHILNAVIVLEAYCIVSCYTGILSKKEIHASSILLMLSVGAFTIKPIGAASLLFSGLLTLYLLVRNTKQNVSSWCIIFTPALCAIAVWITKNIFLSGYPLYPLPIFAMPFDWTMSFGSVNSNYLDVLAWARMPGPGYRQSLENGFLYWFRPWLTRNLKSKEFLELAVFPSSLSLLFWFLVARYVKKKKSLYFFIWTLFSIVYWFITAPDIRFGDGFFWVWVGTAFLFLAPDGFPFEIPNFWKNQKNRIAFFYLFIVLGIFGGIRLNLISPDRSLFVIGTIPSFPVMEYTVVTVPPDTVPPFNVWMPIKGTLTGNSPLPSTPYKPTSLEMREPGNLGKGFRVRQHGNVLLIPGIPLIPVYKLRENISFKNKTSIYQLSGWSYPEEWGTWTDGEEAVLLMDVDSVDDLYLYLNIAHLANNTIDVYVNNMIIGSYEFVIGNNVIKIPKEVYPDKQLTIQFRIKDPVVYPSRSLGIGVRSFYIDTIDTTYNYKLRENISFANKRSVYQSSGWSYPEEWGTWTDGEEAVLHMDVDSIDDLYLYLNIAHLANNTIDVYVNNVIIGSYEFVIGDNVIKIPKEIYPDKQLTIQFRIKEPVVYPERSLGIGVRSFYIDTKLKKNKLKINLKKIKEFIKPFVPF